MITTRTTCRLCFSTQLDLILDLGNLAFSAFPEPGPQILRHCAPLTFCQCRACGLCQLRETVDPDLLFRQYWYRSSINETMQAELTSVVRAGLFEASIFPEDLVLDVGANDGFLLSQYPQQRAHWAATRIAYEPAENLEIDVKQHCEVHVRDFFPQHAETPAWRHRVKILTTIAMFYDLEDPAACVWAIDALLHPDGVWILQFQDLAQMIDATAFDNLCHEHLTYWSLDAFMKLVQRTGTNLHVTHVERRAINGGSLRIHVRRKVWAQDRTVEQLWQQEQESIRWEALERFAWRAGQIRLQLRGLLTAAAGGPTGVIDLYGASTKANTLLQYCGLDQRLIRQAWERNAEKVGRLTATGIPIVTEAAGRAAPPDLLLAGIWQFREAILARETDYLANGGRILFPLPEVDVVSYS